MVERRLEHDRLDLERIGEDARLEGLDRLADAALELDDVERRGRLAGERWQAVVDARSARREADPRARPADRDSSR